MRTLPLWLRWLLSLVAFGALAIAAVAVFDGSRQSAQLDAEAVIQANRDARLVLIRDQAPHSSALRSGAAPQLALERAIQSDVRARVRRKQLDRPAGSVRCVQDPLGQAPRLAFRCSARAGRFSHPFLGVVDHRADRLTWCKFDPGPARRVGVPVSSRCKP